jgi:hypothetical protein
MSLGLLPIPRLQAFFHGIFSPGAKANFYRAGTTTRLNTYSNQDAALIHKNANPVVAGSDGLFGPIYLLPEAYKLVLTTSTDALIYSQDDIFGPGFTPPGIQPSGNATEDTAAIQAAIDAASTTGGTVTLAAGLFLINATIVIPRGVSLIGEVFSSLWDFNDNVVGTTLKWTGASLGRIITFASRWIGRVENLTLDANFTASQCFLAIGPQSSLFKNIVCENTTTSANPNYAVSIVMDGCEYPAGTQFPSAAFNTFDTVILRNIGRHGWLLNGVVNGSNVTQAVITENVFINCAFRAGTGAFNALTLNQCCDTNSWYGGTIEAPASGGTGVQLNYNSVNNETFANHFFGTAVGNVDNTGTGIDARNNIAHNIFFGGYLPYSGTQYQTTAGGGGGKIKAVDMVDGATAHTYNSPITLSPTASPWTFTNVYIQRMDMYLVGESATEIKLIRNGVETVIGGVLSGLNIFSLEPGDKVKTTYPATNPTGFLLPH